jgi:hypothetical protein
MGIALIALLGAGAVVFALSSRAKAAVPGMKKTRGRSPAMGPRIRPGEIQLSKNFKLSEFLRSKYMPELKNYLLTTDQLANLQSLVTNILQPARDKFGLIYINSGGRPKDIKNKDGKTLYQVLKEKGLNPAQDSDHTYFGAADITLKKKKELPKLYKFLQTLPDVRQVILYTKTHKMGKQRKVKGNHIHVSVVMPGKPRVRSDAYAFLKLDGKRVQTTAIVG